MTTDKTCVIHKDEPAVAYVTAHYFDPDMDDDGRPIGWSRAITDACCADCVLEIERDELASVTEVSFI